MNQAEISAAKAAELVAFYNKHCAAHGGKPVAKFADRKTAERRVAELAAKVAAAQPAPKAAAKKAPKAKAAVAQQRKSPAERSAAIARSWTDKTVAAKRATHNKVIVNGKTFRSVRAAFEDLGLPLGAHIKFRMDLKATGSKSFGTHTFALA